MTTADLPLHWHHCADAAAVAAGLADAVAGDLVRALDARSHALITVSGGHTPTQFFAALAQRELDWKNVTITLVDERWVPADNPRSNARLVVQYLLQGPAAAAQFVPLYHPVPTPEEALPTVAAGLAELELPPDVVVLGMGTNGHTASFFPGGDHLAEALDPHTAAQILPMRAPDAGEPRITLTLPVLVAARSLYLHIEGAEKRRVLETAVSGTDYPIRHVLAHAPQAQTWWCP